MKTALISVSNKDKVVADWETKITRDPEGGKTITWIDGDIMPGAFYHEVFMINKPTPEGSINNPPHVHEDWDEIIGIYGTDAEDPYDLGGEIQMTLGDEVYTITRSSVIFIPKGLQHCPLIFKKISKPVILMTTGPSKNYTQTLPADWEKQLG